MALNEIGYDGKTYTDLDISSATGYRKSTIVGDELAYDTFEAEVWDYAYALLMLADSGPNVSMMNADSRFMFARFSNKPLDSFTYGAPVNYDTFDVCMEKADTAYEGAYAFINRAMAASLPPRFRWINREEDLGVPGLRAAKLSYHPEQLLQKYTVLTKHPLGGQ